MFHSEEKKQEYEKQKAKFPNGILASKGIGKLKRVLVFTNE